MNTITTIIVSLAMLALYIVPFPAPAFAQGEVACETDVTVQADDWLSKIADKSYGNVLAFPAIVEATNAKAASDSSYATIDNPDVIEPGWKLCIPSAADAETMLGSGEVMLAAAEGPTGGTLIGAWVGPCCNPVDFLNPLSAGGGYHWFNKIFSHLVTYNAQYSEILPDLAESWSISEDSLTWTINLRPGVTWHDGTPFTAKDVVFSIELCVDPQTTCWQAGPLGVIAGASDFIEGNADSISGLEIVDDLTLNITTDGPSAAMLDVLAETWIVQEASLSQIPRDQVNDSDYWATAVGTGPFKLSNYVAGQFIETVRFDDYWRGAPRLEKLIRREFKDPATALLALEAGEIHHTYLTSDEVERMSQNPNFTIFPGPSQVDNAITLNPDAHPAFAEPKFRQAILTAIDRASIIESLYGGGAKPVNCLYGNPLYVPDDVASKYSYDPEQAKALLEEAGIDPSTLPSLVMDTYYNDQLSQDVMTVIQQNLADIGLNIELLPLDGASWSARYYDDNASQVSFIGGANGADPNRAYQYHYSASPGNTYKHNSPALDTLLDQGRQEMDLANRAVVYQDACRVMSEELPWIYLWETTRYGITSNKVSNFVYTPAAGGGSYYDQAELWTITE